MISFFVFFCFLEIVFPHLTIVKNQLYELKQLHNDGLISLVDFERKKGEILDEYFDNRVHKNGNGRSFDTLVWSDDFVFFDFSKWKHEITLSGGGNWEFEYYLNNRSNSFVRNGILHIRPTFTADTIGEKSMLIGGDMSLWGGNPSDLCTSNAFWGCERSSNGNNIINPIQSARIRTAETFSFKYGRIEINASLPKGDWLWPAIWLLPKDQVYGNWPASGEIDIVESRGNAAGYPAGGVDFVASTLHYGPFFPLDGYASTTQRIKAPGGTDFSQAFHIFGLQWTEDSITTYLDTPENPILEVSFNESLWKRGGFDKYPGINNPWDGRGNNAPFDEEFFIILNLATGGTNGYFPDNMGGKCWQDKSSTAPLEFWKGKDTWINTWGENRDLKVDFVRVYQ